MRLLFNDWKRRFKKAYRSSAAVGPGYDHYVCTMGPLLEGPGLPCFPNQPHPHTPLHVPCCPASGALLQDKAAFSKFTANLKAIAAENVKGKMFLGLNQFSDMTSAEFRSKILTLKKPKTPIK